MKKELVILRKLTNEDGAALARLANNKKVWDNLRDFIPFPYTTEDAAKFIAFVNTQHPQTSFAIEFEGDFCGVISLVLEADVYKKNAEIGYWIGEPFWNKGIATAAVKLITEYAFTELYLMRVHTGVFEYNTASMRVLEKNGFQLEGIFKKSILKNGKFWNEHRYAILKN